MKILTNKSMANQTTFNCGGKAKYFVEVENFVEFENILKLHKGKYYILGNGSKTLCKDSGYDGLVISTKKLSTFSQNGEKIIASCGAKLCEINAYCQKNGLSGLEFSYGIPASVGGAVVMNAGAFGDEIGNYVESVEIFENGKNVVLSKQNIVFSYRSSSLKNKNIEKVVFKLKYGDSKKIKEAQEMFWNKRKDSQPLEKYSAGSVFKRTENIIPAKIIDKLGLKGVKIGGAEISQKHSGFIVNNGNATATDVLSLINLIEEKASLLGISLEKELIVLE